MPLPIGHTSIGLATQSFLTRGETTSSWWKILLAVGLLSNLPDVDVLIGLIFHGNGYAFHRGPTHSLMFALVMGFMASNSWRLWPKLPKLPFMSCLLIILSHLLADLLFTRAPISFLWPLNVHWSPGHSGLIDVLDTVLFHNYQDVKIIAICWLLIILNESSKRLRTLRLKRVGSRVHFLTQPEAKS